MVATAPGEVLYATASARTRVVPLELAHDDPETTALVRRLYAGKREELGMEDADALATADAKSPLASPANAGDELVPLRQEIFRVIIWHDRPDVRAAVADALEHETAAVVETVKYVAWRLPSRP